MPKESQETKTCKHCQSEMPKKAKVCPVCKKRQRGGCLTGCLLGIAIFIQMVILVSCFAGMVSEKKDSEPHQVANESNESTSQLNSNNERDETSEKPKEEAAPNETSSEKTDEFEYGDCTVKYLRHEIMENDMGETVLVVYYDFTNNGDDSRCFDYLVTGTAFQNGVEVEPSYWHPNEESKNSGKEIQKGTTLTVADSYVLGESRENVTIEFRPFNIWSDKLLMSLELTLE